MALARPAIEEQLGRDIEARSFGEVRGVDLPPLYFNPTRTDVLFKRLDDGSGYVLLVSDTTAYLGADPRVRELFENQPVRGWRPLTVLQTAKAASALQQADILFGLADEPPRVAEQVPKRELVVPAAQAAGNAGTDSRPATAEQFGNDLVAAARAGRLHEPLFREREIDAIIRILCKDGKNAACLRGDAGVGKTAVVEGLACRIARNLVPEPLRGCRVLDVNLSFLAAGASYQNEFEGRMKKLLEHARRDRTTILFLDELHTIAAQRSNASQMVKPDLGRGTIRCLGATTNSEFRLIEADPALARRFQPVAVPELTRDQTIVILERIRERYQRHHGVVISDELLIDAVDLAIRYVPQRCLPDKALDLLDEACALARISGDGYARNGGAM